MATRTNLLSNWPLHYASNNNIKIKIAPKFPTNPYPSQALFLRPPPRLSAKKTSAAPTSSMAATVGAEEVLPPVLDSSSDPPSLFDGTTRLYTSYICPYAQRVWIARNYKGLQENIKLVPIDLENRPHWYKEKVYAPNKVPALEHNNEVRGESLDLLKYVDSNFEGPALYPEELIKREFAEELLSYTDTFNRAVLFSLKGESESEISTALDYLETALFKFSDGPFFLGQFSLVDIAYAPFIERFHPLLLDVKKYDITIGRPMLTSWIEEMNKIDAYKQTKRDPQELIAVLKKRFSIK
ncbi:Glutathione S-transferase L3 [Sarracenia purpurea var. burkii]